MGPTRLSDRFTHECWMIGSLMPGVEHQARLRARRGVDLSRPPD